MIRLKKALLLGSFCSLSAVTMAQEKEKKKAADPVSKHEIGVDANAFLGQIFELFGGKSNELNPYLLTYKYKLNPTTAVRTGLTIALRSFKESDGTFIDTRTDRFMNYATRLGIEKQSELDAKWYFTYGFDVGVGFSKKELIIDSGFDIARSVESGWTLKVGPMGGIWYRFSPKISMGTEATYYYTSQDLKAEKIFTANPQFNKVGKISSEGTFLLKGFGNLFITFKF
jgi:hypothetical protein